MNRKWVWNRNGHIKCSKCQERVARFKKSLLCCECHREALRNDEFFSKRKVISPGPVGRIENAGEVEFALSHPGFIHQPAIFRINGEHYSPDFYDPQSNTFYEIIGTRQRFEQLHPKISELRKKYPLLSLVVCNPDGSPYHSTKHPEVVNGEQLSQSDSLVSI